MKGNTIWVVLTVSLGILLISALRKYRSNPVEYYTSQDSTHIIANNNDDTNRFQQKASNPVEPDPDESGTWKATNRPLVSPGGGVPCAGRKPVKYHGQGHEDEALYVKFFSGLCGGTFLEIGALDGRRFSTTLMYERDLGWDGLLIEGSPQQSEALKLNRPNATIYSGAACGSGKTVNFTDHNALGGIPDLMTEGHINYWNMKRYKTVAVPCDRLGNIIHGTKFTHFDFWVLDVEGAEWHVLQTYDWSVPVHVISIEMNQDKDSIREYLAERGFTSMLPEWDIRTYCPKPTACPRNEVFINTNWPNMLWKNGSKIV